MKKQIFVLILSAFLLLTGCSSKQSDLSAQTTATTTTEKTTVMETIKTGKYFGEPYNVTSSFLPILTLEDGNKFKFEIGTSTTVEGTYKIADNKLILNSADGSQSYVFRINNNMLTFEDEIPSCVKKDSLFKLMEEFIIE